MTKVFDLKYTAVTCHSESQRRHSATSHAFYRKSPVSPMQREETTYLSSEDDNHSTTDGSAKDDQSSEAASHAASDSSDSGSESSGLWTVAYRFTFITGFFQADSSRWPKFEHYHHVLNRYRLEQSTASTRPSFVLARVSFALFFILCTDFPTRIPLTL